MKLLLFGILTFLSSSLLYATSADTSIIEIKNSTYAIHALYFGIGAPFNSLWSYDYDCRVIKNLVIRSAVSYIPLSDDEKREKAFQFGIFPAYLSDGRWATELGGGIYYDAILDKVNTVGIFGIRYQEGNHGLLFRIGLYLNLGNLSDLKKAFTLYLLVSTGFSIGYAF